MLLFLPLFFLPSTTVAVVATAAHTTAAAARGLEFPGSVVIPAPTQLLVERMPQPRLP
eukprot:SAG11_NODE_34512_length_271_cov_1.197674_1_plen_57_part_10